MKHAAHAPYENESFIALALPVHGTIKLIPVVLLDYSAGSAGGAILKIWMKGDLYNSRRSQLEPDRGETRSRATLWSGFRPVQFTAGVEESLS